MASTAEDNECTATSTAAEDNKCTATSNAAEDNVVIRNVHYMMAYAFRAVSLQEYAQLGKEEFSKFEDLLAAILVLGIDVQRKRGYERDYREVTEDLFGVRGHIDVRGTARNRFAQRCEIRCCYDEYSTNTYMNQILKCCAELLLKTPGVDPARRQDLKRCIMLLPEVSPLNPARIQWSRLKFHRNNRSYQLLMNVCHMIVQGWLLSNQKGDMRLAKFMDAQKLHALYENFVLAYFKEEHPELRVSSKRIDSGSDDAPSFLPGLYTDVTLEYGNRTLIIDCKCYGQILGNHMGHEMLSPANRNQIYVYVGHEAFAHQDRDVQGMLLYALTENEAAMHESWEETGHTFHCFTLDLSQEFSGIAKQLDEIAEMVKG
ncbi:MAG: hypothetical protein ACI37P_07085 [Eggerthellaceae bacterium]